jgi:hypothetical protein
VDHKAFKKWLESRLEEYRMKALTSDNRQFHFDTRAAEIAAILAAMDSDAYSIERAELDNA